MNNWDFSLMKDTPQGKTHHAIPAEFFNGWNHEQFGSRAPA